MWRTNECSPVGRGKGEGAIKGWGTGMFSSVAQSCPTLCHPMNHSTPGLPVHHQLPECTQTHVHRVSDAIQPSHPGSSPSPRAPNLSQHQSLFQFHSPSEAQIDMRGFLLPLHGSAANSMIWLISLPQWSPEGLENTTGKCRDFVLSRWDKIDH